MANAKGKSEAVVDANERTRLDMAAARSRGKLDVSATRAFLHGELELSLAGAAETNYNCRGRVELEEAPGRISNLRGRPRLRQVE